MEKFFFDWNWTEDDEAIDGIKVDQEGNLFVSAPRGIWIISSEAKLLGKIMTAEGALTWREVMRLAKHCK